MRQKLELEEMCVTILLHDFVLLCSSVISVNVLETLLFLQCIVCNLPQRHAIIFPCLFDMDTVSIALWVFFGYRPTVN